MEKLTHNEKNCLLRARRTGFFEPKYKHDVKICNRLVAKGRLSVKPDHPGVYYLVSLVDYAKARGLTIKPPEPPPNGI